MSTDAAPTAGAGTATALAPTIRLTPTAATAGADPAPTAAANASQPVGEEPTVDPVSSGKARAIATALGRSVTTWWGFVRTPMSLAEAWRRSAVIDARRIPAGSTLLAGLWWWSNRLDRGLLFALLLLLPTALNGPVLWCATRPSRRLGLYAVIAVLAVFVPAAAGS